MQCNIIHAFKLPKTHLPSYWQQQQSQLPLADSTHLPVYEQQRLLDAVSKPVRNNTKDRSVCDVTGHCRRWQQRHAMSSDSHENSEAQLQLLSLATPTVFITARRPP